jgi:hypothetical protein
VTTFQERVQDFERAVTGTLGTSEIRLHRAFGVSNSAKVIDGGIQLAGVNLERYSGPDAFAVCSYLRFAPQDEVLFAVVVRSDLPALDRRLEYMRALGEQDNGDRERRFAARNNNVVAYLAPGGRLLLRNKGYWESLTPADAETEGPIRVDAIHVACSSTTGPGVAGHGAREFVRHLEMLGGGASLIDQATQPARRSLRSWSVLELRRAVEELGGYHPDNGIESLHRALCLGTPGRVAVIEGPSGSGKSLLATRYAHVLGAQTFACTGVRASLETLLDAATTGQPEPSPVRPIALLLDGVDAAGAVRAARTWRAMQSHGFPIGVETQIPWENTFLIVTLDGSALAPRGIAPVVALPPPDARGFVHHVIQRDPALASRLCEIEADITARTYAEVEAMLMRPQTDPPNPATR